MYPLLVYSGSKGTRAPAAGCADSTGRRVFSNGAGGRGGGGKVCLTWIAAVRALVVARSRQHVLQLQLVPLRFQRHGEFIRPASPRWEEGAQEHPPLGSSRQTDRLVTCHLRSELCPRIREQREKRKLSDPRRELFLPLTDSSITQALWLHNNQAHTLPSPPPPLLSVCLLSLQPYILEK